MNAPPNPVDGGAAAHWFCKPSPHRRTHHLHLVPLGSPQWLRQLRFRDALRRDPALAAQYAELKLRLAKEFRGDREAYTRAKAPFVDRVSSGLRPDTGALPLPGQG